MTVVGEANIQRGAWNEDAVIPIVSRRTQSEDESSTGPERTDTLLANFPEHREVGSNNADADFRIAFYAEECLVGNVLERPGAFCSPGCDPLCRGIRIRWGR